MTTIEPGPVATKFADNAKVGELDATVDGLDEPSMNLIKKFKEFSLEAFKSMCQQGEDIANVILEAITSTSPHARYMTNPNYRDVLQKRYPDLTGDVCRKLLSEFYFKDQQK